MEKTLPTLTDFKQSRQTMVNDLIANVNNDLQKTLKSFSSLTASEQKSVLELLSQSKKEVESLKQQNLNSLSETKKQANSLIVQTTNQATDSIKGLNSQAQSVHSNLSKTNQSCKHTLANVQQTLEESHQAQITQSLYLDKCLLTALIASVSGLMIGIIIGALLPF